MPQDVETIPNHTGASGLDSYMYTTLDKQSSQIRVFTLLPSVSKRATLEGRLAVEQLSEKPEYEALSYVWGTTPQDNIILVNDTKFLVARNLFEVLLELRHSTESRGLWIDAICIDQANVLERTHQVNQMRSIYSAASRVLIWLGESDADTREAMTILQDCRENEWPLPEDKPALAILKPGVEELLSRPWFNRVWTIQELLVANMDLPVGCGNQWVPWKSIWATIFSIVDDRINGTRWLDFTEQEGAALVWLMWARDPLPEQQHESTRAATHGYQYAQLVGSSRPNLRFSRASRSRG